MFDFSAAKGWPTARGTKIVQADKQCLKLLLSPSGRVFKVTGDGKGEFSLFIESPSTGEAFVMRTNSLQRILHLIGFG